MPHFFFLTFSNFLVLNMSNSDLIHLHHLICSIIRNKSLFCPIRKELINSYYQENLNCQLILNKSYVSVPELTDTAKRLVTLRKDELLANSHLLLGFTPFISHDQLDVPSEVASDLSSIGQLILCILLSSDIHSRGTHKDLLSLSIKESTFSSLLPYLKDYSDSLLVDYCYLDTLIKVPSRSLCCDPIIIGAAYVVNHAFHVTQSL